MGFALRFLLAVPAIALPLGCDTKDRTAEAPDQGAGRAAVPKLIQALRRGGPEARARAAEALGQIHPPAKEAVELLLAALRDRSLEVRYRAAKALPGAGWDEIDRLIAALRDPDPAVRLGVAYALGMSCFRFAGDETHWQEAPRAKAVIAALAGALGDSDAEVRRTAAFALGYLGYILGTYYKYQDLPRAAAPALAKAMKEDTDPSVRYRASLALMRVLPTERDQYEQEADKVAAAAEIVPYFGFEVDLRNLHKAREGPGPCSAEAVGSAITVFKNMPWKGKTKEQVLKLLGDPARPPGVPAGAGEDDPLEYHFTTGSGGRLYILYFKGGRVERVHEGQ